jgi:hypothetical protein
MKFFVKQRVQLGMRLVQYGFPFKVVYTLMNEYLKPFFHSVNHNFVSCAISCICMRNTKDLVGRIIFIHR